MTPSLYFYTDKVSRYKCQMDVQTCIKLNNKWKHHCIQLSAQKLAARHISNIIPVFHGDLVYKFKRIVGKPSFSDQIKR